MADYTKSFLGLGTNDPYTLPSELVAFNSTAFKTDSQGLRKTSGSGVAWAVHNVSYGSFLTAEVTVNPQVHNDFAGAGVFVRSGANAGKGYVAYFNYNRLSIAIVAANGAVSGLAAGTIASLTPGSVGTVKLTYDKSDGRLRAYWEGVENCNIIDTTYQGESSLAVGLWYDYENTNSSYITALNGTGLSASSPTLTDVDTDETITGTQEDVAITGTNLGADTAARTIKIVQGSADVTQTQVTGNSTSGTFDVVGFATSGLLRYGTATLRATVGAESGDIAITLDPPSGYSTVTLSSVEATVAYRVEGIPDLNVGDQIEYSNQGGKFSIDTSGVPSATDESVTSTSFRIQDGTGWGALGTITILSPSATAPSFIGPTIADATLTQATAMSPLAYATRFSEPNGQPMTFLAVGPWPPGVTVQSVSGTVQGTPTTPGSYPGLTIRATDPDGNAATSNTFAITVSAALGSAPTFIGPNVSVSNLTENVLMTTVIVGNRFADPTGQTLTYSARGTWPAGVVVSTSTGNISGTPSTIGSYSGLSVRATDTDGNYVDSNTFSITVEAAAGTVTPVVPTPGGAPGLGSIDDVSIANRALTKLGEARIISFGDDTKAARAIAACYYIVRDAELRRHKWRFAIKRAALPALTSTPPFGYAYEYQLPADCIGILAVGDIAAGIDMSDYRVGLDTELFSLEGRTIRTDLPAPLNLRYKSRVTDATQFDIAFVEALASRIAYECAEDLTQSAAKKQAAAEDYKMSIREAIAANAVEIVPSATADDSWLLSRQ